MNGIRVQFSTEPIDPRLFIPCSEVAGPFSPFNPKSELNEVNEVKYLGVMLRSDCTWDTLEACEGQGETSKALL